MRNKTIRLLESIHKAQSEFIEDAAPNVVFDNLLGHLLDVTESEYGFIGDVLYTASGKPYLKTQAITNIAWNQETREFYEEYAPQGMEFNNLDTLFGAVMTSGAPVMANDPDKDPRHGGRPPGHPPLRAFLGLPLRHGQKLVGMLGLANRPGGYDEDLVRYLEPILTTCSSLLHAYRNARQHKEADKERRELRTQIQYAQKLEGLGVLAGGIAHDFNNLLTAILGNASSALMKLPRESEVRGNLEQIETASLRAAELVNQMLAYSGKAKFVVKPLDFSALVEEMGRLLQAAISKKVVVQYDLDRDLPRVAADAGQLRQVVMNLMTNASEAIGDQNGDIVVKTAALWTNRQYLADTYVDDQLREGVYVYVEVTDSGCGMDNTTQEKLFEPFFTTKFSGRGLGLAAVLGIVRGHGGAIKIDSEPNNGTTIRVLLPSSSAKVEQQEKHRETPGLQASHHVGSKILVVDDEQGVRSVSQMILENAGFSVLTAKDGGEGLEVFLKHKEEIHAVLLDLTMPQMDGEEVFRQLRRICPKTPVILSSGYNEQVLEDRFEDCGFAGFLQKPYGAEQLIEKLNGVIQN